MRFKFFTLFWCGVILVAAVGLYFVKYRVQALKEEVASVAAEVAREQDALHVLKAELAYLSRPERLSRLADRHLELAPSLSRQMVTLTVLPDKASLLAQDTPGLLATPAAAGSLPPLVRDDDEPQ